MLPTVELATIALVRPSNKCQTALPLPGRPSYQGALYRTQLIELEDAAELYGTLGRYEVEQSTYGDAGERLAALLREPLALLSSYPPSSSTTVETWKEVKLVGSKGRASLAAAKLVAHRVPVTNATLNVWCEEGGVSFDSDCLQALNQALEPYGAGVVAVTLAV